MKPTHCKRTVLQPLLWCLLIAAFLFVAVVRIRLLDFPLERDEGEYAYAGQLMLQGIPPYLQIYNMKFPGIYAAYALIMSVFSQTAAGIHLGLLFVNLATAGLLFFLARRLAGFTAATVTSATFLLLSVSPSVLGMAGHATHFVLLPAVAGFLLLLAAEHQEKKTVRLFLSGVCFGIAFLMKQHGVFFGLFGGLYVIYYSLQTRPVRWRRLFGHGALYSVGVMLPIVATCLMLYHAGVFKTFWFWTFSYARQYAAMVPWQTASLNFSAAFARILHDDWCLWLLAGLGAVSILIFRNAKYRPFIAGFFLFSFLAVCPGFYFRPHYFILFLPAVSLAAGLAVSHGTKWIDGKFPAGLYLPLVGFVLAASCFVFSQKDLLLILPPEQVCRRIYGVNPFPEALRIADYLREHSSADAEIAVIGSEPEINFYAGRKSASGHIYMYGLMEPQPYALQMQEQLIREVESADPEYIVVVNVATSWLARPQSEKCIFFWLSSYLIAHYEPVGLVDILSADQTEYYWNLGEEPRLPQSRSYVLIYRHKTPEEVKEETNDKR